MQTHECLAVDSERPVQARQVGLCPLLGRRSNPVLRIRSKRRAVYRRVETGCGACMASVGERGAACAGDTEQSPGEHEGLTDISWNETSPLACGRGAFCVRV